MSLIINLGQDLIGKKILCFSYGSGCAASLFGIRVCGLPFHPSDLLEKMRSRIPKSIDTTLRLVQAFEGVYGKFGFEPINKADRQDGAYYLKSVDALGVRCYEAYSRAKVIRVEKEADRLITWIEFLQETLNPQVILELQAALEPGHIHIFTSACENFCVGGSIDGDTDLENFLTDLSGYADLHSKLKECCQVPIIVLCNGSTRGGGMLFPSMADVVLSTSDATFGYPEIRRGVLPGFVSLSATKRLSKRQCLRWMLTGDTFDATVAKSNGFVDIILDGGRDAVRSKLMEFVANVLGVPSAIQIARKRVLASGGNHISAILESGKAILANINLQVFPTVKPGAVTLSWPDSYTAHIQFENPHGDCARSWNMVSNLANLVEELKGNRSMRAVVSSFMDQRCNV